MPGPDRRPSLAVTIALLVIGSMILIPSGLCTGIFMIYPIVESFSRSSRVAISPSDLGLVLSIGGPFVLIGGLMVWRGIARLRRR